MIESGAGTFIKFAEGYFNAAHITRVMPWVEPQPDGTSHLAGVVVFLLGREKAVHLPGVEATDAFRRFFGDHATVIDLGTPRT